MTQLLKDRWFWSELTVLLLNQFKSVLQPLDKLTPTARVSMAAGTRVAGFECSLKLTAPSSKVHLPLANARAELHDGTGG